MKQTENPDNWISGRATDLTERDQKGRFHEISITRTTDMNPSFDGKTISNNRLLYTLTLRTTTSPDQL